MFAMVEGDVGLERRSLSSACVQAQARQLRLRMALNLFKRYLLGPAHVANLPQVDEMLQSPGGSRLFEFIGTRTWESWFDEAPPMPKCKTIRALDHIALESIRYSYACGDAAYGLAPGFFEELVHGGLVSAMAKPGKSKRTKASMGEAVDRYEPLSAWHLHMDAVEVSSMAGELLGLNWKHVKQVAAKRLMSFLYRLWAPRGGAIYQAFASDHQLQWRATQSTELAHPGGQVAGHVVAQFNPLMDVPPKPNWSSIGIGGDLAEVHVHKALLAMAADPGFLAAERVHAWSFDLATAALAMHALAWTDRYKSFGLDVQGEQICWMTLSALFFSADASEWDERNFKATMHYLQLPWSDALRASLMQARSSYLREIDDLGIDLTSLTRVAAHAAAVHQWITVG